MFQVILRLLVKKMTLWQKFKRWISGEPDVYEITFPVGGDLSDEERDWLFGEDKKDD